MDQVHQITIWAIETLHQFKMKTNIIFTTLALVTILAFYLLNAEIAKILVEIEKQEIKLEEHQKRIDSQKNIMLFQGARIRQLEKSKPLKDFAAL